MPHQAFCNDPEGRASGAFQDNKDRHVVMDRHANSEHSG
jgi:hypothetical protein